MNIFKKFLCLALVLFLILPLSPQVHAENESAVEPYARQMLQYYLTYQEDAQTDIERLLYEMGTIDAAQSDAWRSIMNYWSYAHSETALTPDVLPDGLPSDDSLCIVVLGYALASDGSMQKELIGRLKVALASAEKYPNAYILCTGGGTASNNSAVTEAGQMASWLEKQGIDRSRIIVENRSLSTTQNAVYSYKILRTQYPQIEHLAIVTSDYHMSWGYMAFATEVSLGVYVDLYPHLDIVGSAVYPIRPGRNNLSSDYNQIVQISGIRTSSQTPVTRSELTSISVLGNLRYYVGDDLNLTVIGGYDNGFSRNVTADAMITDVEMRLPGTRTIRIRYEENGVSIQTAVEIELLYLAEGETHPEEPEVILIEEATPESIGQEAKIQKKPRIVITLILMTVLGIGAILIRKSRKPKRRRRRKMYL